MGSAGWIRTARLELMPDAGHAVWIDNPHHVAAVTTRFLLGTKDQSWPPVSVTHCPSHRSPS